MFSRLLIISLILLPHSDIQAADTSQIWEVDDLLKAKSDSVVLRDRDGIILKRVERKQLLIMRKAMSDIESASERQALLTIIKGDRPNASAGPVNGRDMILINFAMLDTIGSDRDQWLAVRASTDNKWTRAATGLATTAIDTKFSRDHERESDYLGLIWAVEKGYDSHGAVALHTEFSKLSKGIPIPFLESHPSSKERIKRLSRLADQLASKKKPEPIESEKSF